MGLNTLTQSFPWSRYSKKLSAKIDQPKNIGNYTTEEAEARAMRLVLGNEGRLEDGNIVQFYWLIDKDDGIIVGAKFQVYGQSALVGAAEAACDLLVGKNYDQAKRISSDLIDKHVRDKAELPAFPRETFPHLNLVLGAIETCADQCTDLPLADTYISMPAPREIGEVREGGFPGWNEMTIKKKLAVIEEVLDLEIRPYIALDAGGVTVKDLINDRELIIIYQGSCTSCYSAVGTTLSYIQQMLRAKVHPDLLVVPDLSNHTHL